MYLLDSNIILELLLNQENADDVELLLERIPPERLYLSEFALYSRALFCCVVRCMTSSYERWRIYL